MAELLTLDEARKAINLPSSDTSRNTELEEIWIPAVTKVVEDISGPIMQREETLTVDGGGASIVLPYLDVAVTEVLENGEALVDGISFAFNSAAGILWRGTANAPTRFVRGSNNVVVTFTAGYAATAEDVPANIKLAAMIILANIWQSQETAYRPALGGAPENDTSVVPTTYAVPNKALELLGVAGVQLPGFA